ncbi:MAG: helix-turn-helix domain-containing protein [Lentisphaeria bacterium]|nr:helix-turn-helix domain-containing protein [Lentisphaeria bacterium]
MGRKGSSAEWLTDDGLVLVQGWARDGLTDEQIAKNIGIAPRTYYEWQERFPQFRQAIKKGKAPVDVQVENALLKRALGYEYEETITEIEEVEEGRQKKHIRRIKKHMPPDVGAIVFWLKNRKPGRWRDKIETAPEIGNELLQSLFDLERRSET